MRRGGADGQVRIGAEERTSEEDDERRKRAVHKGRGRHLHHITPHVSFLTLQFSAEARLGLVGK